MTVVVVVVQITIFSLKESFDSSKFAETGDSLLVESSENSRLKKKKLVRFYTERDDNRRNHSHHINILF